MAKATSPSAASETVEAARLHARPTATPVAIEARGIEKTFRIPEHRIDSLKERMVHPLARASYRDLHALRGVSFDIHRGEFFGIVGRNGSGKSTLLKILASIYRADAGRIRVAGTIAPFIELGVGFNADLTARENVVLNGVMMGLTQREARRRLDAVLEFAELEDFVDLKLKNYSSGMLVRLAFSGMIQSDADILLIDEVLAVGDAAFRQKCADVFHDMRDSDRTVVLVTHDMGSVQAYCDRAMLLEDGEIRHIGDPDQTGREYLRINFAGDSGGGVRASMVPDLHTRLVEAWLEDADGGRIENVEAGEPIRMHAVLEASTELRSPEFAFMCTNADGVHMFQLDCGLTPGEGRPDVLEAGRRVRISGTIDNQLAPGRYSVTCLVTRRRNPGDRALQGVRLLDFVVYGPNPGSTVITPRADVEAVPEEDGE